MKGNIIYVNERITMKALRGGQAFGTDSYLLAAYATHTELAAVEFGSGIGVCSLLLADRRKAKYIYAVEIQKELHDVGVDNFLSNKMPVDIKPLNKDIRELDQKDFSIPVGMVIANPPYFKKGSGIQSPIPSKNAARFELNGGISDFADAASRILVNGGLFYTVMRPERQKDLDKALIDSGFAPSKRTFVYHKSHFEPAMILTEAIKGKTQQSMRVTKHLVLHYDDESSTEDAKKIYDSCDFGEFLNE